MSPAKSAKFGPVPRSILTPLLIFAVAFVLRLVARLFLGEENFWVGGYFQYFELAQNIIFRSEYCLDTVYGVKCAYWPPIYPLFVALFTLGHQWIVPITIAQAAVGGLTAVVVFLLGRELFDKWTGIIAGSFAAIYPYYVFHDVQMQETGLVTFLVVGAVYLLVRSLRENNFWYWIAAGSILGLAVLTRATVLPFAGLALIWLLFVDWRRSLVIGASMFIIMAPWLVRNQVVLGAPALTTQTGRFLWLANHDSLFPYYPERTIDLTDAEALARIPPEEMKVISSLNEIEQSRYFERIGLRDIKDDPGSAAAGGLTKLKAAFSWNMSPRADGLKQIVYFLSYFPILILGIVGIFLSRKELRRLVPIYLLFLSFCISTFIFWAHTSHRTFLDVYLMIFAAVTLTTAARRFGILKDLNYHERPA